jgi:uncharacterized protein YqfA (UPF0365 family)
MVSLEEMQAELTRVAQEQERRRVEAHRTAMEEIAAAQKKEELRQAVAKEQQRIAKEKRLRADKLEADAKAAQAREEAEERRLIEEESNRRQEAIDADVKLREDIKKRLDEMEHNEEMAKKALRDAIIMSDSRPIEKAKHPLAKFLQTPE